MNELNFKLQNGVFSVPDIAICLRIEFNRSSKDQSVVTVHAPGILFLEFKGSRVLDYDKAGTAHPDLLPKLRGDISVEGMIEGDSLTIFYKVPEPNVTPVYDIAKLQAEGRKEHAQQIANTLCRVQRRPDVP